MKPSKHIATYILDDISQRHLRDSNEPRKCIATHSLDGISYKYVRNSDGAQKMHRSLLAE